MRSQPAVVNAQTGMGIAPYRPAYLSGGDSWPVCLAGILLEGTKS